MNSRLPAQSKQRFTSEIFWHFTGRDKSNKSAYEILLSILRTGLKRGGSNVEFKFVDTEKKQQHTTWGYPVVCLADIPFKDLGIHMERYGFHAIGFHKEAVILNHFNPVLYVNQHSSFFRQFMETRERLIKHFESDAEADSAKKFDEMLYLLGSIAVSGDIWANPEVNPKKDQVQLNNFYYEREWRSINDWNFKAEDVAAVIVPDLEMEKILSDKKSGDLKLKDETPILAASMIYRL